MIETREKRLADIFLDHSLKIKKNDRLVIMTSGLEPKELIRECYLGALRRGAHIYLDTLGFSLLLGRSSELYLAKGFFELATRGQLKYVPPVFQKLVDWGSKFLRITSIEDPEHLKSVKTESVQIRQKAFRKVFDDLVKKKWTLTYTPTLGMAKRAGMSLKVLWDFYYGATLVDYGKMRKDLRGLERIIDQGRVVRVRGYRTDLTLGINGRNGMSCFGEYNVPDGEVFTGPEETKTEGYVYFDFPAEYMGKTMKGVYIEFKNGKVVKASAEVNDKVLKTILDTDAGARRLGEFAIGANYNIQRHMQDILFDEKIGGTVHMALGKSYTDRRGWGKNVSAIHWDIVKDTRKKGSEVWVDKKVVLRDGKILV